MSYEMNIHERINITGSSAQAQALKEQLTDYIRQINHMTCLESIVSLLLTLSNGTDTVRCGVDVATEPGNTWVMTESGLRQKQTEHVLWTEEHPLMKMLASIGTASNVVFEWSASLMKLFGADYGSEYWQELIAASKPESGISYRTLETNDFDACARAICSQGGSGPVEVPRDQPLDAVKDIGQWYCGNFGFNISGVAESEWDAFKESVGKARDAFAEVFDDSLDIGVFRGEAETFGSFFFAAEQTDKLAAALQKFADIAEAFGAHMDMEMDFDPDEAGESGFSAFALIRVKCDEGKVSVSACRFDE